MDVLGRTITICVHSNVATLTGESLLVCIHSHNSLQTVL